MILPSACPAPGCSGQHPFRLRELVRIEPTPWYLKLWARVVAVRIGYLLQCPLCLSQYVVTENGLTRVPQTEPGSGQQQQDDVAPPAERKPRPPAPPWRAKPSI